MNKDASISYWNLQYGVRKGDELSVEWLDQNGVEKFQFDYVADKNYWYQYFWTYDYGGIGCLRWMSLQIF
ncbi:MAG: hypothetical protein IPG87_17725 [Saprospiraceae bacterium]|nr:hypothetical protein [Candidatus Vicinibacter affinis]